MKQRIRFLTMLALSLAGMPARAEDPTKAYDVQTIRDIPYYEGDDADKLKHKLDLYLPKDQKDFPVLMFVHGGGWVSGDKNHFGVYAALGRRLAMHGIGAVVISYRLSPKVNHPEHIKDVARAFAWTHANIAKHGGQPNEIFVCGHSAGGHLVALLATDESYLKPFNLKPRDIRGVIPMSGVFSLDGNIFSNVFGSDTNLRKSASPLTHVHEGLPPFRIIYADSDFPGFGAMAEAFGKALKEKKVPTDVYKIEDRNHFTIILAALQENDPALEAILTFMQANTKR